MFFKNRYEAGVLLAEKLQEYRAQKRAIVFGIPRGGVVVGKAVVDSLKVDFGVVITKKIGAPDQQELAIGAVGPDGSVILDHDLLQELGVSKEYVERKAKEKADEIVQRFLDYKIKLPQNLKGKKVILVDDGVATGSTVEVAVKYLRAKKANKIILAIPVAPETAVSKLRNLVDQLVILHAPFSFNSVGQFYKDFPQVTDEEVVKLLKN